MFGKRVRGIRTWLGDVKRGQSLVEVAIAFPVLLIILAGILDLGRAYMTLVALNDAAAEGATYAARSPTDRTGIEEWAMASSSALIPLNADNSTITVDYVSPSSGQPVTVTIEYEYQLLTPIVSALVPDGTLRMTVRDVRMIIGH